MMFELIEAVSGRLIGPKSWNRIIKKILKTKLCSCDREGLFGGVNCINCATKCIVICIRPEMVVKFGFTK